MNPPISAELFSFSPDHLWVMHCAEGPIPRASARAVEDILKRELHPWEMRWEEDVLGLPHALRRRIATLFGSRESDITLTSTTSSALTVIAQSFPWERGDEVIAPLGEFPSNAWPWLALGARGVTFREVSLWDGQTSGARAWEGRPPEPGIDPEARLLEAIGPATKLMAVSWVRFQDGVRLDVERLAAGCRDRGVRLVVDGIQGAGTRPVEVAALDAFATGGHKGLLAPAGLGFLTTSPDFREQLSPAGSWLSVEDCSDFSRASTDFERAWADDGTRFEQGLSNLMGCVALHASLGVIEDAGVEAIASHVAALQQELLRALGDRPECAAEVRRLEGLRNEGRLGSVLSFHHGGAGPDALARVLREGQQTGIDASVREGYLRIALHGWHTRDDVHRVVAWLERALTDC